MKKSSLLTTLFAVAFVHPLHAQLEFVANGSSQGVTSIPGTSGPGELGYYIFTDAGDAQSSSVGYDSAGTLANFAPSSYDTTDSYYSTLTIAGTPVQTDSNGTASPSNNVTLGTITLGVDAPSSFQLGFLEDNSDGAYYENENNITLSANGSTSVTIAAYNLAHDYGVNDFYYVDVLNATPGEVITITGSSAYPANAYSGQYNIAFGGITFDAANPMTYTWTGAGDGTFDNSQGTSSPSNYTGGTGSNFPGAIDTAQFNVTPHTSVTLTGNDSVGTLVFGSNGLNASSYTFGSGYTLNVGTNLFVNAGVRGATETFNNTMNFTSGGTIVNQGSSTVLNFSNITGNTGNVIMQGGQGYGSETAGDRQINVTGSISGGIGLTANLAGAVANLENTNSYTGPTTMNSGVLKYTGSATSGTPFGTGSVVLNGGKMLIAPTGNGTYSLTGATNSGATFTYGTAGMIQITAPTGGSVTYTVGSGSGTVFNSSASYANTNPTLIIETSLGTTLGTTENLVINGNAPTLTNGIVGVNVVGESASNGFGSYLTYGAAGTSGFSDYLGATVLAGSVAGSGSTSTNYSVGPTGATLNGGLNFNTMTVTNGALNGGTLSFDGTGGVSGLLLNNATVSSSLSLADTGYIYTAGHSTISSLINSNHNDLAISGPGTLTLTGLTGGGYYYLAAYDLDGPGALSIANAGEAGSGTVNAGNTPTSFVFSGGTLDTTATMALDESNGSGTGANAVVVNAGGGTFDTSNNTTLAVTGVISGSGPLYKTDGGTLIATGNNTFTGPLTIGAVNYQARDAAVTNTSTTVGGTLLLTGSNQSVLTTVAGNGTRGSSVLGGTGSITATNNTAGLTSGLFVQNGGSIAPGMINPNSTSGLTGLTAAEEASSAPGVFTFTGAGTTQSSVNFTNGGNLQFLLADEKDSSNGVAGTDFNQLVVSGNAILQLGGTSSLTLDLADVNPKDAYWDSDHSWQIVLLTNGATSDGTIFASVTDPVYANGLFLVQLDSTGEELIYEVPEPSTWVMLLSGCGLLAYMRYLRQRRVSVRV
jgi:fibronectin-binding autotransporter adhesin